MMKIFCEIGNLRQKIMFLKIIAILYKIKDEIYIIFIKKSFLHFKYFENFS